MKYSDYCRSQYEAEIDNAMLTSPSAVRNFRNTAKYQQAHEFYDHLSTLEDYHTKNWHIYPKLTEEDKSVVETFSKIVSEANVASGKCKLSREQIISRAQIIREIFGAPVGADVEFAPLDSEEDISAAKYWDSIGYRDMREERYKYVSLLGKAWNDTFNPSQGSIITIKFAETIGENCRFFGYYGSLALKEKVLWLRGVNVTDMVFSKIVDLLLAGVFYTDRRVFVTGLKALDK